MHPILELDLVILSITFFVIAVICYTYIKQRVEMKSII